MRTGAHHAVISVVTGCQLKVRSDAHGIVLVHAAGSGHSVSVAPRGASQRVVLCIDASRAAWGALRVPRRRWQAASASCAVRGIAAWTSRSSTSRAPRTAPRRAACAKWCCTRFDADDAARSWGVQISGRRRCPPASCLAPSSRRDLRQRVVAPPVRGALAGRTLTWSRASGTRSRPVLV